MANLQGSIFGIGNPLLDIMVDAHDADFEKYVIAFAVPRVLPSFCGCFSSVHARSIRISWNSRPSIIGCEFCVVVMSAKSVCWTFCVERLFNPIICVVLWKLTLIVG